MRSYCGQKRSEPFGNLYGEDGHGLLSGDTGATFAPFLSHIPLPSAPSSHSFSSPSTSWSPHPTEPSPNTSLLFLLSSFATSASVTSTGLTPSPLIRSQLSFSSNFCFFLPSLVRVSGNCLLLRVMLFPCRTQLFRVPSDRNDRDSFCQKNSTLIFQRLLLAAKCLRPRDTGSMRVWGDEWSCLPARPGWISFHFTGRGCATLPLFKLHPTAVWPFFFSEGLWRSEATIVIDNATVTSSPDSMDLYPLTPTPAF